MSRTSHLGNIINAFSNKDFKLINTAITVSSNIDTATPGTIIYNKDKDVFEGFVSNTRSFNNSNFVPMNMDIATQSTIGGIKIGNNLTVTNDGILNSVAESVSRKFQKVLIVSQSLQINNNPFEDISELATGDYRSINQCLKQFFDYNASQSSFTGEISNLNKEQYPDPSPNNIYVVLLTPGEYKEDRNILNIPNSQTVIIPPFVALVGDDRDSCIINIKNLTSLQLYTGSILRNLTIDLTNANENLIPSSVDEIIKGIELLTESENIVIENVKFKLSACNFNTSFLYTNTNNNVFLNNITLSTPSIPEGINNVVLTPSNLIINVIDSNTSYINMNNCDLYLESHSHKKSIIKADALSLVNCKSSKLEIKELNTNPDVLIENQVIYLIDSSYNAVYTTFKCQGFDNNFTNTSIRNQGIRMESTENYNITTSTEAIFQHDETNNSHDLIKVPKSSIDFTDKYISGSRIKISGSVNNNITVGVSYVTEELNNIELESGTTTMSVIGCDVVSNVLDEIINISDSRTITFKELFQTTLYACKITSDSETLYSDSETLFTDNYFIQATQTVFNGVNPNVGNNTLIFNVPNEIIVGKANSNFNSIGDALNSITTANSTNKVIVRVKPGTYLESTQLLIPEHVSLIGENSIIKFDSHSFGFPENVCILLSSNTTLQDVEIIFDASQDSSTVSIGIATANFTLRDLDNLDNEDYYNLNDSIENITVDNVKLSVTDGFIPDTANKFMLAMISKASNVNFNNINIDITHTILALDVLDATIIYSKLSQINFNSPIININGTINNFNYNVLVNDASNNVINNPSIRSKINTESSINNQSVLKLVTTVDPFITGIDSPDLSVYNTLVLGGSVRTFVSNENVDDFALFADYNSTLIAVGVILEGLCKDRNDRFNNHPNSFLKTMNCYLLSSNGEIVAGISEVDQNGQPTIEFDSLHVGDPVGSADGVIPRENVLVGIRVALLNQTGTRNVMLGVDVGVFQESGSNNVYLGYRSGRKNLRNDNIFIGSGVADEITEGQGTIAIGKDTVSNANNLTDDIIIGNNTGTELNALTNAVIIGTNSVNTANNSNNENLIVIGSNNVCNNLTTGKNILTIGNESMLVASTLTESVVLGHKSAQTVETGTDNISIGNNTCVNMIESINSITIGNNAAKGATASNAENINNIMIGNSTGGAITTAKDNILIGTNAGTSLTTGSRNMIMGSRQQDTSILTATAPRLTTGNDNIILGTESGKALTTGSRNLVLGNHSGDSLNVTSDTIIIGYDSGNSLTGGGAGTNKNIIIGNQSANIATTGDIIIIGHESGTNLTGDDSLVIGNLAARNIAGGRNTVIGNKAAGLSDSAVNNVVGTDNVLIGTHSGYHISTGSFNIILGSGDGSSIQDAQGFDTAGAGYSLVSGDKNFMAGFNAGRSMESGDENVLIGARAGYTLTASNRNLIIGNNAGLKLGSNDTQTPSNNNLILGNDAGSEIGIGNNLLFIGQSAGRFSTEGDNNTFIGNNSGENNKGNNNTYIGNQSGQSNESGDNNTMIGVNSGKFSDNANFNTFIGFEAGKGQNTNLKNSGDFNTVIGYQAGSDIVEGSQNLYLGYQAGQRNEFGSKNIAIGPNAGLNSQTSRSIFIGATENTNTGVGMRTTGQLNLFIGTDTGVNNTTGEKNTFLGSHTGQNNITGSGGIFIGVDAGQQNTTGNDNTFIGREAGQSITDGVNNIMIGKQAGTAATNRASENILIGTLAGSKTEINDSINIGNKSGENNETGTGNILIGPRTGQNFEQSRNNIMIGSNAGASFKPTGSNITLGENIYIGPEVGRDNIIGNRNIVIGSEAFKSSVQGSGVIAIGFKAAASAGVLAENVGGKTYENTIIGFEAGSQGDYATRNVMVGAQSGRNIDNARECEGNVLLGAESGKNANTSINSVVLGSANRAGQGGINNVIAGTNSGNVLGVIYSTGLVTANVLLPGMNDIRINETYNKIISVINSNDRVILDDGVTFFKGVVTSITEYYDNNIDNDGYVGFFVIITLDTPYTGTVDINIGASIRVLATVDDDNVGNLDTSKASSNTLMGNQSANKLTVGSKNVALGDQSMHENTIGKYNNVLGTQAGYNIKSDNNTVFGTKAGFNIDSYISNSDVSFTYNGFTIMDNTIQFDFDTVIDPDISFGTIIDINNTTSNNNRYRIIDTTENTITVEGSPKIEELGVSNTIDPDSIIVNGTTYNFVDKSVLGSSNTISVSKVIDTNIYSTINNSQNNIGEQFGNAFQVTITGSKFNDGVHYLYKDNTVTDNFVLRPFTTMYPEVFDSNVTITSKSINTNSAINTGFSFLDINQSAPLFAFLGSVKGTYRTTSSDGRFINIKPLKNSIGVVDIFTEKTDLINNIFTVGHIEDLNLTSTDYFIQKDIIAIGDIEFVKEENENPDEIIFTNSILLEINDDNYYVVKGTNNNNNIVFKIISQESGFRRFIINVVSGTLVNETITSTIQAPVKFKVVLLNNLSKDNSDIISQGNLVNINMIHTLGQKAVSGTFLIENSFTDNNTLLFSSSENSIIPNIYDKQGQFETQYINPSSARRENVNLRINKEIFNVDSNYLANTDNHINGYDLLFQSYIISTLGTLTSNSVSNSISSTVKYEFKDIIAPCMIKFNNTTYYLVISNKYPFNKLVIDPSYTLPNNSFTNANIHIHSVSTAQNTVDLSKMQQGVTYKIFGNELNNLVDITPVSNSSAISSQSVFLTPESAIVNYQGNNKLIITESRHDDYDFVSNTVPSEGYGRGYFKHVEVNNANVNIVYDNINTQFEKLAVLGNENTSLKEYVFLPDGNNNKKYNLVQIGNVSSFEGMISPDNTFTGASNLNIIALSNTFTFMGDTYSNIAVSTYGYLYFDGNTHKHVYNFLVENGDDNISPLINSGDTNSNIRTKIINSDSGGTSDVLLIDFTSNANGVYGINGLNNCQLELYLDNSDYRQGRIYTKYSNVDIETVMNGIDTTEASIKDNRFDNLVNNVDYNSPIININNDNYTDYDDNIFKLINNRLSISDTTELSNFAGDDSIANDSIGYYVKIENDYLISTSRNADSDNGAIYVFKKDTGADTYSQVSKLSASDPKQYSNYGISISINNDYIAVGASNADSSSAAGTGAVYVYKRDTGLETFTEVIKIEPTVIFDPINFSHSIQFGIAVIISGDYLYVSATGDNGSSGSVYIYKRDTGFETFTQVDNISLGMLGVNGDNFGKSISIYNDYLVVGSPGSQGIREVVGFVYVYKRNTGLDTYSLTDTLTNNDLDANALFGTDVSIYGDYIVIGAPYVSSFTGEAFVYKRDTGADTFTIEFVLNPDTPISGSLFGISVSIYNNNIIVGASGSSNAYLFRLDTVLNTVRQIANLFDVNKGLSDNYGFTVDLYNDIIVVGAQGVNSFTGRIYTYKIENRINYNRSSIRELNKLNASDGVSNNNFGRSVSMYNEYVVIGADADNLSPGAAYVFKYNSATSTYSQIAKLIADDGENNDGFGGSVYMYDNYIVIGASRADSVTGAAYLFKKADNADTFTQIAKLIASDRESPDLFGISVSMYNEYIMIGASGVDTDEFVSGAGEGAVYVFKLNILSDTVTQIAKLMANDNIAGAYFGYSVDIHNNYIAIGAYGDSSNAGAVYVFKKGDNTDTFTQIEKITETDDIFTNDYGKTVTINDDYIIVGATNIVSSIGTVYIIKIDSSTDTFTKVDNINPSDGASGNNFGNSIRIFNDYIIIGASDANSNIGAAYLFKKNTNADTFAEVAILSSKFGLSLNDYFGFAVAIYNNNIVIGSYGDMSNIGTVYTYKILNTYEYIEFGSGANIDTSSHTKYTDSFVYNSNIVLSQYLSSNIFVSIDGYILLNNVYNLETEEQQNINNVYLTVLNGINASNVYARTASDHLSFVYEKDTYNLAEAKIYFQDNYRIEYLFQNLNTIFTPSTPINSTFGVNLLNNNEYNATPLSTNLKILTFNNLDELDTNNVDLLTATDILNLDSDMFQVANIVNSNILIYNSSSNELFNQTYNILVNQYVGYDYIADAPRYDFEKQRQMVGEHADFLRFVKVRSNAIRDAYANATNAVNSFSFGNILDKGLNYTVKSNIFTSSNTFNSNVVTKHIIPLVETVPNEFISADFNNNETIQNIIDHYAIALGEPVLATDNENDNINCVPKGLTDVFVVDSQTINTKDTIIFQSQSNGSIITGDIQFNNSLITISNLSVETTTATGFQTKYIEEVKYGGIKKTNTTMPLDVLKPGNLIYITKGNLPVNGTHANSTYLISSYSTSNGLVIGYDTVYNNATSNVITFGTNLVVDNLKIELSNISVNTLPTINSRGHLINERYNFANFNSITTYNNNVSELVSTRQFIAVSEYPILNYNISANSAIDIYNYINYTIPEWGFKPTTSNKSYDTDTPLSTLDFFYNGLNNKEQIVLDYGNHSYIIPTSNISQNINSTNLYFKNNIIFSANFEFSVPNYTLQANDSETSTYFSELDEGQIISVYISTLELIFQVGSYNKLTGILELNRDYLTTSSISTLLDGFNIITLPDNIIASTAIMSRNIAITDLSLFKSGQKLKVTRTANNNNVKIINPNSYTTPICLLVDNTVNEEPDICTLERIVLQPEVGIIADKVININAALNTITIPEPINNDETFDNITFASFNKNQRIIIPDYNTNAFTTISDEYPSLTTIKLSDDITVDFIGTYTIYKQIIINIVGKPITSTIGQAAIFHFEDAQGNNMMLGSFTGQFCGVKNLAIHNTYIGNKVGQTNHGSGNVFFGSETGLATSASDGESFYDNKFAVYKNNFIGIPDRPLIGGDFGSGRVGINTINPDLLLTSSLDSTTKLVVNGAVRASSHTTFTGSHIISLSPGTSINDLVPGMIMSSTGNVAKLDITDTIVECKLTDKEKDKKVFGVYSSYEDNNSEYIYYVAGVGEGQLWVCNINGDVEAGDYVCSSRIPGYVQMQDDDITHNYTVAKITETIDWEKVSTYKLYNNVSYKVALLGCVYMCS